MRTYRLWITTVLVLAAWSVSAHRPSSVRGAEKPVQAQLRGVCANSGSQIDQDINNVRARLLGGGDCWWNLKEGRYIVPKIEAGSNQEEVSSIYAGSVWLGGIDPGNNLKLACQDYRNDGKNDFWPGPLDRNTGTTDDATCKDWDRHFEVSGEEIRRHLANLTNGIKDPNLIPRGLRGWPARGNPYFVDVWGFELPFTKQSLAGFFDKDGNGLYDPLAGDYPSIEIRGCEPDRFPDEMIFWIYNDQGAGAPHARTNGVPIQMEVQVQAFGYLTNDELNDMTFQRYKLINRATDFIDSTFFAMWIDPDLGCFSDDYIGCDSSKSLMFVYNQDATDGQTGCTCPSNDGNVPSYCNNVPILGVDYFRGPLDEFGEEIGMSSFMYYNNGSVGNPPAGTSDPSAPLEYYRYITGTWRDGTPLTIGGSGYAPNDPTRVRTRYAFPDAPNDQAGWSMCTANLTFGDRRTLQASGPFRLVPGALNELIIGVPWVPDIEYPCPDLEQLFRADKLAQGLFDNCFDKLDGPFAPTVDWIELNQQVIAVLTNKNPSSNNIDENYREIDILAPDSLINSTNPDTVALAQYKFEGYKIYQLINPNVSGSDFDDPTKARLVQQVDRKNGVSKVYNWVATKDPLTNRDIYYPEIQVDGEDKGVRHTFSITEDRFALGNDKRLINHKKYYYAVIAYAYNSYGNFDPLTTPAPGQQLPYLPSSKGPDGNEIEIFTVIPRPIVDRSLQANYGEGVVITRLQGIGTGGNFLELDDDTKDAIWQPGFNGQLTYQLGQGPITVNIFNPFEVKDGEYELSIVDENMNDTVVSDSARWQLRRLPDGPIIASDRSIAEINEQIILQYGFTVTVAQTALTGNYTPAIDPANKLLSPGKENGAIGGDITYKDPNQRWLNWIADAETGLFHYIKTRKLERDEQFDPFQSLSTLADGIFVPLPVCDWDLPDGAVATNRLLTPAWTGKVGGQPLHEQAMGSSDLSNPNNRYLKLNALPNVDIILTSDTSRWSRCVVVETANDYFTGNVSGITKDPNLNTESPAAPGRKRVMFDVRYGLSVGKKDADGDGKPDPDGAKDAGGKALRGMGWFPGYAIDVETGKRLNIFFGENSCYSNDLDTAYTGRDMMWNPTNLFFDQDAQYSDFIYNLVLGSHHWVYVSNTPYDGCEKIRQKFNPESYSNANTSLLAKRSEYGKISWAGMLTPGQGFRLNSLREGLIPNEVTIKLRVQSAYRTSVDGTDARVLHPKYRFKIDGREAKDLNDVQIANALDSIKVVPNPYYGFSQYEQSQFQNIVKITNLPAKCDVMIYSLDGKFIRRFRRNEQYEPYQQITPELEWDLKNNKGIPVASGVYLIHIKADGLGERTVKWFGIARQFDPSGL